LKTICMLVMINPVLDGAVVTICQMGNMAEWEIQLVHSNNWRSLKNWQPRTLCDLMIEELQEWGRINGCCNIRCWYRRTTSAFTTSWMSLKACFRFVDTTSWTLSLNAQKYIRRTQAHFLLWVTITIIKRSMWPNILWYLLISFWKLTICGMIIELSVTNLTVWNKLKHES
jgi:hypothetical protein